MKQTVVFGNKIITIEDIVAIAFGDKSIELNKDEEYVEKIRRGALFLEKLLEEDGVIYGVTTGYGDSCTVAVPPNLIHELPIHLSRFHGCGLGQHLDEVQAIAVLATRLASLGQGFSGVRYRLLHQLELMINHRVTPLIPEEGSVGASGDLTPLSYVAAAMIGERELRHQGEVKPAKEVLDKLSIEPVGLMPKEGLAIMNGTAVMTALACLAWSRTNYLSELTTRITALASIALMGNSGHFDEKLFSVKPHKGQQEVAAWIRTDLNHHEQPRNSSRLQDRYSIRCAPHIIGVLRDALPWMKRDIENEINSANDNPIIDAEGEHVLHGGHFYGGHIAFVMDSMKNCVANLADLMDRQMALLMDSKFNHGLPANLTGSAKDRIMINHGFKATQIAVSAWTAEALKLTIPASIFSRSTECHNQDKVSMGTIAARDCLRILQLTEQVAAACLMAVCQGVEIRCRNGEIEKKELTKSVRNTCDQLFEQSLFLGEDRMLEGDLRNLVSLVQKQHWELYS